MNIFILDRNPVISAIQLCDKHVVKMPLETAQMLCTAINFHGGQARYKSAYVNHPCTVWARANLANFNWLCLHGKTLCSEYTQRYKRKHKCEEVIVECMLIGQQLLPQGELTSHPQCMPEKYKSKDPVQAYRNYYLGEKSYMATWKQNKPEWWAIE